MTDGTRGRVATGGAAPRPFIARLPETLDPAAVTRPEWAAYAAWVVSAVVVRRRIDRGADDAAFVPLATRYVERHIPPRVRRELLDDLLRAGVLECDGVYYFGRFAGGPGKCRCYRLGAAYRGVEVGPRPVSHPELLRKLAAARAAERAAVTDPTHLALRAWHDRVDVLPDAPYGADLLLDVMIDGERRFTVCGQGRVHTNVANLPAQFRRFIRLAGRELDQVDIATSQPLLLALLLESDAEGVTESSRRKPKAVFRPSSDHSLSMFRADCLGGAVYDPIAAETGLSRDEVKSKFLAVIYGHPGDMHTRVGEAIRRVYPGVFAAVADLNDRLGRGGLPRLMQRLESRVMIDRVAAQLVREHPDMPLLTVHDSILAPAEYVGHVRRVVEEEWLDEFGVVPRTKTSTFTAPQEARRKQPKRRGRSLWDSAGGGRERVASEARLTPA